MQQVTLNHEDIEWDNPNDNGYNPLKPIIHNPTLFAEYTTRKGTTAALHEISLFHRHVANQLIEQAIKDPDHSVWAGRTIRLCQQLKRRRRWLRGAFAAEFGHDALDASIGRFEAEFPRAVWGSKQGENQ